MFRIEELDVGRDEYFVIEDSFVKFFKVVIAAIWVIHFGLFVITICMSGQDTIHSMFDHINTFLQVGFYMILGNFYFWTEMNVMWLMFLRHKYEFKRHAC